MIHKLKIKYSYASKIAHNLKTFELRRDDRNFKVGDWIVFEIVDSPDLSKLSKAEREEVVWVLTTIKDNQYLITYKLNNVPEYGLNNDYCILSIIPFSQSLRDSIAKGFM